MKGIILAGRRSTLLHPLAVGVSNQIIPVYDKPMVYYPLSVLMRSDIREILIVATQGDLPSVKTLLGDGSEFGLSLSYAEQSHSGGLADTFVLARSFIGDDGVAVIPGDNIFFGPGLADVCREAAARQTGATVFARYVDEPEGCDVIDFDNRTGKAISIEVKSSDLKSNWALTGLCFYDNHVVDIAASLKSAARSEIDIMTVNNVYLERNALHVCRLSRGYAWFDAGTHDSLYDASSFVRAVERRQGMQIACLEEIAMESGWLTPDKILARADLLGKTPYAAYLRSRVEDLGL